MSTLGAIISRDWEEALFLDLILTAYNAGKSRQDLEQALTAWYEGA